MLDLLFVHWNVDPVIFHIGRLGIRWYSLLFISGFILGWYIFKWFFKREGVSEKLLDPLLYTLLIATIVGARLGHCLFYQPDYYLGSWKGFWEIFQPWKGGLASHGGAIALLLAMWWFARRYGRKEVSTTSGSWTISASPWRSPDVSSGLETSSIQRFTVTSHPCLGVSSSSATARPIPSIPRSCTKQAHIWS